MDKVTFNIGGVNIEMDKEEASKAFEAGTVELKTDDLVTYKKDEFETFKTNLANDEYKKGKLAGEEMPFKQEVLKEKFGVDVTGKSIDLFAEAYKTKILAEAKVEPSKKIQELEGNFNSLQTNYNTLKDEYDGYKTKISEKETQHKKDSTLLSFMPDNIKVDKDIALMALKSKAGIDVSFDDSGRAIQTINGQMQKDKSLEPIGLSKDFMTEQLTALGLVEKPAAGGRGGGNESGGGSGDSYEAFTERMKANNIDPGSEKFSEHMNAEIKAGTLKM